MGGIRNEAHEAREAWKELVQWMRNKDWKATARNSVRRKYWWRWLVAVIAVALIALLSIFRDKIVALFEPHKAQIVDLPASWLIPVGIIVLISFPPLFGQEIVLLVIGLIWGLWVGFGIAVLGTLVGELLCFLAFKYMFTAKAEKIENENIMYACLARLMRDGGLFVVTLVRFSVIPGHVVTAIQSTVGMPIWIYAFAIIITSPKLLVIVYLGVLFGTTKATATAAQIRHQRIVSLSVFFFTTAATLVAAYIVYMRARKLYPDVKQEFEERNALKLGDGGIRPLGSVDDFANIPMDEQRAGVPQGRQDAPYDDPFDVRFDVRLDGSFDGSREAEQARAGREGRGNFSPLPTDDGFNRDGRGRS